MAPTQIGRYRVEEQLGEGGVGMVFAAHDPELGRRVAVKLLRPDRLGSDPARAGERLREEAQAMARLAHPNVATVFDVGEHDGGVYIAMELIEGKSLRDWLDETIRPWKEVLSMYFQAGRGLAAAHDQGLVHRDFKPGNCIRGEDGRVRVLDFGLARAIDADEPATATGTGTSVDTGSLHEEITGAGALLGTLPYMSLEQLQGRPAGPRSDQFSYCVALYEALHATRPFPSRSAALRQQALEDGVPPRTRPEIVVPHRLRRVLLRGLAPHPEARWPSMHALLDALRRALRPWWRRPHVLIPAAVLAAGGLVGLVAEPHPAPCADAQRHLDGIWD
ncbi:MAG: serine/threonine protein kinase, partial [Myxococcales bacterium]|nr:serine/threonine protein kinase [Myxococcales bacterium]